MKINIKIIMNYLLIKKYAVIVLKISNVKVNIVNAERIVIHALIIVFMVNVKIQNNKKILNK